MSEVVRQLVRQLVYTIVLLVVKGKFGKHRKVSKYYETDCLQNLILPFMFLLTTI